MNAFSYNTADFGTAAGPIPLQGEGPTPKDALTDLNNTVSAAGKNPVVLYLEIVSHGGKNYAIGLFCFPEIAVGRAAIIAGNTTI
jgi:hypothetical protein